MAKEYKKIISVKKKEAGALMTSKQLKECKMAIHTAAMAAGASGAVPIPVMDTIPITAAQVTMVIALGNIFDQKITESAAKGVLSAMASTVVGRSLVKLIPLAGWIASATVAAGVTEAIGWSVAVDLAKKSRSSKSSDGDEVDHTVPRQDIYESMRNEKTDIFNDDTINAEVINEEDISEEAENPDDESVAKDFSKAFGKEEE